MKKKILVLGVSTMLLCGCGKIPKLSNGDDAIITFKDNEMISVNDFYKEIKDKLGLDALINMLDKYIYEREFADEMSNAKTYAEASLKQLRANYDSDEELLQAIQSSGLNYQTLDAYQESIYLSYLQNHAIETYVEDNITEDELKEYYEKNVYPSMEISHILITPAVTDSMSDTEKKEEETKAKDEIESIIKELNQAKKDKKDIAETFSNLAKEHSEDSSTKDKGGALGEINIGSLSSKYDELVKKAADLKDNEYSTEVITTELGYHVILKTKTGEKASYDDSLDTMKDKIKTEKLTSNRSLVMDAIKHYRDKYELNIVDSELDSQYSKYMNNLINYYKNLDNSSSN